VLRIVCCAPATAEQNDATADAVIRDRRSGSRRGRDTKGSPLRQFCCASARTTIVIDEIAVVAFFPGVSDAVSTAEIGLAVGRAASRSGWIALFTYVDDSVTTCVRAVGGTGVAVEVVSVVACFAGVQNTVTARGWHALFVVGSANALETRRADATTRALAGLRRQTGAKSEYQQNETEPHQKSLAG